MTQMELLAPLPTGKWDPFISVYPGNKGDSTYRSHIFGERFQWGAVLEPFCGTGATSLYARCDRRFLAESAPDVRAIWQAWIDGQWHEVVGRIRDYQRCPVPETWAYAKGVYHDSRCPLNLAAASLVLRKLAFGGVIRHNRKGRLNVTWNPSKIPAFLNWDPVAPPPPSGISLTHDWKEAVLRWEAAKIPETLVLLDPPYYLPYKAGTERRGTGLMTPAYRDHRPHSEECLKLTLDPLRIITPNPNAKRIVVCNYYSDRLQTEIVAIARATGRMLVSTPGIPCKVEQGIDIGVMGHMNRGNGKPRVKAVEKLWILE